MFKSTRTKTRRYLRGRALQRGSALIIALVFLLVMTLIGVTAMRGTSQQERMAGNVRDRNLAFQAAETSLRAGEGVLQRATLPSFDGTTPGLIQALIPTTEIGTFWLQYNWTQSRFYYPDPDVPNRVQLGELSQQPQYVIERLPSIAGSDPAGSLAGDVPIPDIDVFRITSRAVGGTADAVVILQTTFRR